ncbi:unnamed protein product [Lactuca saligna]|uniref:Uncharacterized protein n=1 Tax=Lactuca saligna TaxID=75948 RepID=A0AA35Z3K6_LACSI|nr:unnamed protein product [Lactuca saligna]
MRGDGGESDSESGPDSAPVLGSESNPDDEASEADDGSETTPCDESESDGKVAGVWGGNGSVHTVQGREVVGLEILGGGAGTAAGGTTGLMGSKPTTKDCSGRDPMWALDSLKQAEIEAIFEGNTVPVLFHGNFNVKPLWIDLSFLCECIDGACDLPLPNLKTLVLKASMDAFNVDELIRILKYFPKLENLKLINIREVNNHNNTSRKKMIVLILEMKKTTKQNADQNI